MTRHILRINLMISFFLAFAVSSLQAQETPSPEDQEFLLETLEAGYTGHYRSAVDDLEDYLEDVPDAIDAWLGLARIQGLRGQYEAALEAANQGLKIRADHLPTLVEAARILGLLGRYEESESRLREALERAPSSLMARFHLAQLLDETGRREESQSLAKETVQLYRSEELEGQDLCLVSLLHCLLGNLEAAARAAVHADMMLNGRKGSKYRYARYEPLLILGDLYRRTRLESGNRALTCYQDGLQINPNHPGLLLGLARTRYYASKFSEAHDRLDEALAINPVHAESLAFKAHLLTLSRQYKEALVLIERGLAKNKRHKGLLTQRAAVLLFQGDRRGYEENLDRALGLDPHYGEAYRRLGELLIYHFRFSEAEAHLRKGLHKDPDLHEAHVLLGRALANLGREDEAQKVLEESVRRDPFNYPWRENMLQVLSDLESFVKVDAKPFTLLIDVEEAGVLKDYVLNQGKKSVDYFREKYGTEVPEPIRMEMFPLHRDFAVRTVGFTGLGALGACFGQVVTLLSPKARPFRGSFNWSCTLHHEICHVFTLAMSRFRIPRWLTEGVSVYEEGVKRNQWRRNLDMELFNAYHNHRLFRLENFDRGFMGPRILFAYYQAGLTVSYIVDRFGMEGLCKMIEAYGSDLDTPQIVETILGLRTEEFDQGFRRWVAQEMLGEVKCSPRYDRAMHRELLDQARDEPQNTALQLKAARACLNIGKVMDARYHLNKVIALEPENGLALLLEGDIAFNEQKKEKAESVYLKALAGGVEDLYAYRNLGFLAYEQGNIDEALSFLAKAKSCFPSFIEPGSPRFVLLDILSSEDREEELLAEMEGLVEEGFQDLRFLLRLGDHYAQLDRPLEAAAYYEEAVGIDPFQMSIHVSLARMLREANRLLPALRELEIALQIEPEMEPQMNGYQLFGSAPDRNALIADIRVERGEIYLQLGNREAAAQELEKALALNPNHGVARDLKKKLEGPNREERLN